MPQRFVLGSNFLLSLSLLACRLSPLAHSFLSAKYVSLFRRQYEHQIHTTMTNSPGNNSPMKLRNLQAIIFDIDGTLADSWKLGYDATLVVLVQNGVPKISLETYHEGTRYATPDRLARHAGLEPGDADYETVGNRLATEFDNLYVGLVNPETAGFYAGIHELLEAIPSKVALGALTNACVDYAHAVLKSNADKEIGRHYSERFRSVRGADNVPKPKPAPLGLLQVCEDLGVDPRRCVYVGDSPSDGQAAHNAGMASIGVTWGSHSTSSLQGAPFSVLCRSVEELRAALNIAPSSEVANRLIN